MFVLAITMALSAPMKEKCQFSTLHFSHMLHKPERMLFLDWPSWLGLKATLDPLSLMVQAPLLKAWTCKRLILVKKMMIQGG